jgi:hypothetical protein
MGFIPVSVLRPMFSRHLSFLTVVLAQGYGHWRGPTRGRHKTQPRVFLLVETVQPASHEWIIYSHTL